MIDAKELAARLRERSDWLDGVAEGRDDASIVAILCEAADALEAQAEEIAQLKPKLTVGELRALARAAGGGE